MAASDVWASPPIGAAASPNGPAPVALSITELPIIRGSAGLVGRPRVRPIDDDLISPIGYDEQNQPIFAQAPSESLSLPGNCLRKLTSPRGECFSSGDHCAGLSRDGTCLVDLVRAEHEAGREPKFEIDQDGYWLLKG